MQDKIYKFKMAEKSVFLLLTRLTVKPAMRVLEYPSPIQAAALNRKSDGFLSFFLTFSNYMGLTFK